MVSRVAWLYTALVVGSAAALTAVTPLHIYHRSFWVSLIILQLLFLICDCPPAPLASRQSAWSPSSAATLAGVVLLGPVGAALVGAVSVLSLRRQPRLAGRLFNGGMYALAGYLAGQAFAYMVPAGTGSARRTGPTSPPSWCRSRPPRWCTCWSTCC